MERFGRGYLSAFLIMGFAAATLFGSPAYARQVRHQQSRLAWKQVTRASWYGREFRGHRTASGGRFNPMRLTAAHRTLQLGSKVKVTELRSGRSVVVQITDRGPYSGSRGIDLSYAAAKELGIVRRGVARVSLELVAPEEPCAPDSPIVTALWGANAPWLPKAIVE
jgi:rare lipoprotein A (peptidoglycan hydrolase)